MRKLQIFDHTRTCVPTIASAGSYSHSAVRFSCEAERPAGSDGPSRLLRSDGVQTYQTVCGFAFIAGGRCLCVLGKSRLPLLPFCFLIRYSSHFYTSFQYCHSETYVSPISKNCQFHFRTASLCAPCCLFHRGGVAVIKFTARERSTRPVVLAQADKAEDPVVLQQVSLTFLIQTFFFVVLIGAQSRPARTTAGSPFAVKRFHFSVRANLLQHPATLVYARFCV